MSKPIDLDKYRSIGVLRPGYKKATHEKKRVDGKEVEHWDGRQDAVIRPKAVKLQAKTKEV